MHIASENKVRAVVKEQTCFVEVEDVDLSFSSTDSSATDGVEIRPFPVAYIARLDEFIMEYLDKLARYNKFLLEI